MTFKPLLPQCKVRYISHHRPLCVCVWCIYVCVYMCVCIYDVCVHVYMCVICMSVCSVWCVWCVYACMCVHVMCIYVYMCVHVYDRVYFNMHCFYDIYFHHNILILKSVPKVVFIISMCSVLYFLFFSISFCSTYDSLIDCMPCDWLDVQLENINLGEMIIFLSLQIFRNATLSWILNILKNRYSKLF